MLDNPTPPSQLISCRITNCWIIELNYIAKYSSSPTNYPLKPVGLWNVGSSGVGLSSIQFTCNNWNEIQFCSKHTSNQKFGSIIYIMNGFGSRVEKFGISFMRCGKLAGTDLREETNKTEWCWIGNRRNNNSIDIADSEKITL